MVEKTKRILTLVFIHARPRVLLGMKKRGFGAGRWSGFGGRVEEGETIEGAARRELLEGAGIEAGELEKIGVNQFEWQASAEVFEVHIFKSKSFKGEPRESDEISPRWFFTDEIPFTEMWPADVYWFPYFMRNKKFHGRFIFDGNDKVVDYSLEEVTDFV
jgi:8-oxo-dGTP diphosphatase/2-hydroxy-dATP diphosphatase